MPHPIVRNHYITNVRTAVYKARNAGAITHAGLRGVVREIFVGDLLAPLLPPGFEIGSGQIIDHTGKSSAECDVVIYDRSILPPILYDPKRGHFPVEACIYAIEVKSVLKSDELDDAITKARKLWSLKPLAEGDFRPRPAVFAFSSDLKDKTELDRYLEKDPAPYGPPTLNPACCVMCVVGRSYHYWNGEQRRWGGRSAEGEFVEIMAFLAGVVNSFIQHTAHRKGAVRFGQYLIP